MAEKKPNFQQAMEISATWLQQWDNEEITDEVLADRIGEMVASFNGARGFLVISLAGDCPLMDRLPDSVSAKLRQAGASFVDLSVRNLAMSTAMTLHHKRLRHENNQADSTRVTDRCTELLRILEPELVKNRLEKLLDAALRNTGEDVAFLKKWGYDSEQINAICDSIYAVAEQ